MPGAQDFELADWILTVKHQTPHERTPDLKWKHVVIQRTPMGVVVTKQKENTMSNEYPITPSKDVWICESSCRLSFQIEIAQGLMTSGDLTPEELRTAIIKQIEVLSYYSDDPDEVLNRFNVKYGQTE